MFILKKKIIPQNVPHSYTPFLLILDGHLILSGMMVFFHKLRSICVSDKFYHTINSMHASAKLSVKVGNYCTDTFHHSKALEKVMY